MKLATLLLPLALCAPAAAQDNDVPTESKPIYAAAVILNGGVHGSGKFTRVISPDRAAFGLRGDTWTVTRSEKGKSKCTFQANADADVKMAALVRFDKLSAEYSISGQQLTVRGKRTAETWDGYPYCFQNVLAAPGRMYCPTVGYQAVIADPNEMQRIVRAFQFIQTVPGCEPVRLGF